MTTLLKKISSGTISGLALLAVPLFCAATEVDGLDFHRSFLRFELDPARTGSNNVSRRRLMSSLSIEDVQSKVTSRYYLGVACRAEDVYGSKNRGQLFLSPGYEFYAVFASDSILFGRKQTPYRPQNSSMSLNSGLKSLDISLRSGKFAVLSNAAEIQQASRAGIPLQARVSYQMQGRTITLEFPIDIMNTVAGTNKFQGTAGPVLVPAKSWQAQTGLDHLRRAHIVFKSLDEFELVEEAVTSVGIFLGKTEVMDYREINQHKGQVVLLSER